VRRLTLSLDGLPALRDATGSRELDLAAAVTLAGLAGVDGVRLGVIEELRPVRETDVTECRRAARRLELRMAPTSALVKVALEARPDRVVLASHARDGSAPLDLRGRSVALDPVVRTLAEAGIPTAALVTPDLEAVKRVHGESIPGIEFYTGSIVDLPDSERRVELERLGDAVRLAAKLHMSIGLGGALSFRSLPEVLEVCPAADSVCVGRAALGRSLLVGIDRTVRDLLALVA
jgi:pyridoxine 5'-phosphate synthase PdxJ